MTLTTENNESAILCIFSRIINNRKSALLRVKNCISRICFKSEVPIGTVVDQTSEISKILRWKVQVTRDWLIGAPKVRLPNYLKTFLSFDAERN